MASVVLTNFSKNGQMFYDNFSNIGIVQTSIDEITTKLTQLSDKIGDVAVDISSSIIDDQGVKITDGLALSLDGIVTIETSLDCDYNAFSSKCGEVKTRIENLNKLIEKYNRMPDQITDPNDPTKKIHNSQLDTISQEMQEWGKNIDDHIESLATAMSAVKLGIDSSSMKSGGTIPAPKFFQFDFTYDDTNYLPYLDDNNWSDNGDGTISYVTPGSSSSNGICSICHGPLDSSGKCPVCSAAPATPVTGTCQRCGGALDSNGKCLNAKCGVNIGDRINDLISGLDKFVSKDKTKSYSDVYAESGILEYLNDVFKLYRDIDYAYSTGQIDTKEYNSYRTFISNKNIDDSDKKNGAKDRGSDGTIFERFFWRVGGTIWEGGNRGWIFKYSSKDRGEWNCIEEYQDFIYENVSYHRRLDKLMSSYTPDENFRDSNGTLPSYKQLISTYSCNELEKYAKDNPWNEDFYLLCAIERKRLDFMSGEGCTYDEYEKYLDSSPVKNLITKDTNISWMNTDFSTYAKTSNEYVPDLNLFK